PPRRGLAGALLPWTAPLWSDDGPIGPETHRMERRCARHDVAPPRSRGPADVPPAPLARPRSWPGTAARPMAPRSRGDRARPRSRPLPRRGPRTPEGTTEPATAPDDPARRRRRRRT